VPAGWINHIPRSFVRSGINPRLGWFLLLLEDFSGLDPRGSIGNRELRKRLDCSDDTVARLFRDAEHGGYLRRVPIVDPAGRMVGREGFVWLRRPSGMPGASALTFDQVVREMSAAAERKKGGDLP
jgi:hypothetical protein